MNNEQNKSKNEKKGKKIILPPSVEQKMKNEECAEDSKGKEVSLIDELKHKLARSEDEIKKLHKEYMLLQAEFSNFQKRQRKLEDERAKYALQPFVSLLLSHIDSFEQALGTDSNADAKTILEGFMLIYNGFIKAFTDFEIKVIIPKRGEVINLELHEVMLTAEDPEMSNNTVLNVIQKGYTLADRVIRPAKVVAVKNSEPEKKEKILDENNQADYDMLETEENSSNQDENLTSEN